MIKVMVYNDKTEQYEQVEEEEERKAGLDLVSALNANCASQQSVVHPAINNKGENDG